jgi:hypothetical protein
MDIDDYDYNSKKYSNKDAASKYKIKYSALSVFEL